MLTQTAEYALRAMVCLAADGGELLPTTTLAQRTRVPANYLAKVLQQLAAAGLIRGRRGVGGGYQLARPGDEVTLLEVIEAVGPVRTIEAKPSEAGHDDRRLSALQRRAEEAVEAFLNHFRHVTLQQIAEESLADGSRHDGASIQTRVDRSGSTPAGAA